MRKLHLRTSAVMASLSLSLGLLASPAHALLESWATDLSSSELKLSISGGQLTFGVDTSLPSGTFQSIPRSGGSASGSNVGVRHQFVSFACTSHVSIPVRPGSIGSVPNCTQLFGPNGVAGGVEPDVTQVISGGNVVQSSTLTAEQTSKLMASGSTHLLAVMEMKSNAGVVQFVFFDARLADASSGTSAAEQLPVSDNPGVSFAGFLISGASGRAVEAETAGTLRFTGKRLNQVASATIGGIAVTVSSATRSALELDFDSLPEGKHDVVLTSKSGAKTTLRGFVTVN